MVNTEAISSPTTTHTYTKSNIDYQSTIAPRETFARQTITRDNMGGGAGSNGFGAGGGSGFGNGGSSGTGSSGGGGPMNFSGENNFVFKISKLCFQEVGF